MRRRGPKRSKQTLKHPQASAQVENLAAQRASASSLSDFDLGELYGVEPSMVIRGEKDEVGAFMLALALAFNDLKGVDYLHFQLGKRQADANAWPLAQSGQYAGMRDQAARLFAGIIHEILVLLAESSSIIESEEMRELIAKLPDSTKEAWLMVLSVAQSKDRAPNRNDATSIVLTKIRNGLAFHYAPKTLVRGYLAHFDRHGNAEHRSHAVISVGDSMEQTRFYFADAAASAGTSKLTGLERGEVLGQIFEVATKVNEALRWIITLFLRERSGGMVRYPPQG